MQIKVCVRREMLCCQHLLKAGIRDVCQSPGSSSTGDALEKQLLNKKQNETSAFVNSCL